MSKQIKQMEMDALKATFQEVRDMVFLSVTGLDAQADNRLRLDLRKKNIRLQVVKNSLAQRVFGELGMKVTSDWVQPTMVAWGGSSLADLSKECEAIRKKNDKKVKVKGALSEGLEIPFEVAIKMPTRTEAIGRVIGLAPSPASRVISQLLGPASRLAGQIKTLTEKKPEETPAETATPNQTNG